ncbi:peptidoglycan-binding protein [Companilactobacillus hulinensis]|uniref:peptidoglycan-binding protein n=1 Tax=Companilactobacillus hulinensis TaxID=2486007 RepID=UPI000F7AB6AF|nr:peptidoglycan-binding protein [Companilactobacillus hulinensis]
MKNKYGIFLYSGLLAAVLISTQPVATGIGPSIVSAETSQATTTSIKVGVVKTHGVTSLYKKDGQQVKNRALAADTLWLTDKELTFNDQRYYRVSTSEYVKASDVSLNYGKSTSGIIRVKSDGAKKYKRAYSDFEAIDDVDLTAGSVWKYNRIDEFGGLKFYQIADDVWINSDDATTADYYQNPSGWLQISNSQIQPVGNVGYDLYSGVEGVKVWLVRGYFGLSNHHTIYDAELASDVRSFQSRHGLPVTGIVDLQTWEAMGFSSSQWYGIDSYVSPLQTNTNSSRTDHVNAMIDQAEKYVGLPWISGASSSPAYGVDCSGLVVQAMYASGINPEPVSSIQHAQPGNEWNSRLLWADSRIHQVSFGDRQRGDLIFFADPATGVVWHVGILTDANDMVDSYGPYVGNSSIYSNKGLIVGVKRIFY